MIRRRKFGTLFINRSAASVVNFRRSLPFRVLRPSWRKRANRPGTTCKSLCVCHGKNVSVDTWRTNKGRHTKAAGETATKRSSSAEQLSHSLVKASLPTKNSRRSKIRRCRACRAIRCSSNGSNDGATPVGWGSQTRRSNSSGAYVMILRTHL